MASNYAALGTDPERLERIAENSVRVLTGLYAERTHFLFELLQNAEDALARREGEQGRRSVSFKLRSNEFRISHFGTPFDTADVNGICGIGDTAKGLTDIGRFGIGFKSVYAFTDRPEIYSGDEAFAIERFISPVAVPAIERDMDETLILIPLDTSSEVDHNEIADGLRGLGARTLLFLRQIEEITWSVEGGSSGNYLRESHELDGGVRRIVLIGQEEGSDVVEETWLVFSRPVYLDREPAGHIEIAFLITHDEDSHRETVQRAKRSTLVVFFPTECEMHLGFLVQGPYRTTPSRDNVPRDYPWNQQLVCETAFLLVEALCWLRDHDLLDTAALGCLPLDRTKFGANSMFAPLFEATRQALSSKSLLPRHDGGHVAATSARLARTQDLLTLFGPDRLAALFGLEDELWWLSGDITQNRTPELWKYFKNDLDVMEITPEILLPKLKKAFLETQPDNWICELYEFLNGQPALLHQGRLSSLPLVRLENGEHVLARSNGEPQAFLPSAIETDFPTVRCTICNSDDSRKFLQSLGLTEPDPVDDIIRNVLPKYCGSKNAIHIDNNEYEADIHRILKAFTTDSKTQREKLIGALRQTAFVMTVDAGDGSMRVSKPGEIYLATERLRNLFVGVGDVLLVDHSQGCLKGEEVRELLVSCGAARCLQAVSTETRLTQDDLKEIRRNAGLERSTWQDPIEDFTLRGLQNLLKALPQLDAEAQQQRACLLWEALSDLESRRGSKAFLAEHTWGYSGESRTAPFEADFVRQLNTTAWVPTSNAEPKVPEFVVFDTLSWKPNPFLLSKIRFKPPAIEMLAKEAGIEPGMLDLLKKLGVTSEADLRARLGIKEEATTDGQVAPDPVEYDSKKNAFQGRSASGGGVRGSKVDGKTTSSSDAVWPRSGTTDGNQSGTTQRASSGAAPSGKGSKPFISYIGVHPDKDKSDPDGLDPKARMELEEKAIRFILDREEDLQRTSPGNLGYDLWKAGEDREPICWVEVKAMTGCLNDRSVGLSHTQFECAGDHREAYWLYIVERAGDEKPRILRIQDPAGRAKTFTFDRGWIEIAEVDG